MHKKQLYLLFLFVVVVTASSCSLFRKKNKCMSCPTWHDEIEVVQPELIQLEEIEK
ncbi:MAG: hypothetical protein ACI84C_000081 [Flavobacteriales bacterium]|jgi:hypothetical protein